MGNRLPRNDHRRSSAYRNDVSKPDTTEGRRHPNHHGQSRSRHRDKLNSCPDLVRGPNQNHPIQQRVEDERKFEFKIYRSFSDLPDSKHASYAELPPIAIRVYRRSTEGLAGSGKAQSLPRGMERMSYGSSGGGAGGSIAASQDLSSSGGPSYPSHPPSTCSGAQDVTTMTSHRTSRRTSMRSSMASIAACKVSPEEFPDVSTIQRKLAEFESHFVHCLVETFQCLPPLNQLSSLSVAIRPDRASQSVSLLQYLESDSIPADLAQEETSGARREFVLTVSPANFERLQAVKQGSQVEQRLTLAHDIASDLARDAASELCRMFEYQLSLVHESIALRMLAKHAVDCVYDVIKRRQRLLDKNTAVQGAVKGRPRDSTAGGGPPGRKLISVIVGSKELKWNIFDIFKKPGLRKDLYAGQHAKRLQSASLDGSGGGGSRDELRLVGGGQAREEVGGLGGSREELVSWRFYASAQSEPMLYGYRGQMVEWDFVNEHYRLSAEDEASFSEEVTPRYDDFHRLYCPYTWLVGLDAVQDYLAATRGLPPREAPTLVQHVKQSRAGSSFYVRDDIKLVFRPLRLAENVNLRAGGAGAAGGKGQGGGGRSKVLVSDAAIEITRACDALRCQLDDIDTSQQADVMTSCNDVVTSSNDAVKPRRSGSDKRTSRRHDVATGGVSINVTCPDGRVRNEAVHAPTVTEI